MTNVVLLLPNFQIRVDIKHVIKNKATKNSLISQSESTEQYYKIHFTETPKRIDFKNTTPNNK